jgi:hypothetical protein
MPENSKRKQGHRFQQGQSGNPSGKPKGARHKTTILAEKLMQDDAEGVVNAVVAAAKDGDMAAARLVLDRIAPVRKDNPVRFDLPAIESASDASAAMAAILRAVASGELTPGEAGDVAKLIETFAKTYETNELEARIAALEAERGQDEVAADPKSREAGGRRRGHRGAARRADLVVLPFGPMPHRRIRRLRPAFRKVAAASPDRDFHPADGRVMLTALLRLSKAMKRFRAGARIEARRFRIRALETRRLRRSPAACRQPPLMAE